MIFRRIVAAFMNIPLCPICASGLKFKHNTWTCPKFWDDQHMIVVENPLTKGPENDERHT